MNQLPKHEIDYLVNNLPEQRILLTESDYDKAGNIVQSVEHKDYEIQINKTTSIIAHIRVVQTDHRTETYIGLKQIYIDDEEISLEDDKQIQRLENAIKNKLDITS